MSSGHIFALGHIYGITLEPITLLRDDVTLALWYDYGQQWLRVSVRVPSWCKSYSEGEE